jgi:serine/threonine protein kinase
MSQTVCGTPAFIAPEVLRKQPRARAFSFVYIFKRLSFVFISISNGKLRFLFFFRADEKFDLNQTKIFSSIILKNLRNRKDLCQTRRRRTSGASARSGAYRLVQDSDCTDQVCLRPMVFEMLAGRLPFGGPQHGPQFRCLPIGVLK